LNTGFLDDMSDNDTNQASDLREETAAAAPEVAEHDAADARLEKLEAELAESKQAVLYAHAEAQNIRRRAEKETADARAYASTAFARDLLSVADNLARGLDATGRELEAVFQRHGIKKMTTIGEKLDPNFHQAMFELPSDEPAGTVVQEMQSGYMIKDRLLRPALVGVAKAQ
jgi:molecular chaperone GrpE